MGGSRKAPAGCEMENEMEDVTYMSVRGFVNIKCGECGETTVTCLHEERTIFVCRTSLSQALGHVTVWTSS